MTPECPPHIAVLRAQVELNDRKYDNSRKAGQFGTTEYQSREPEQLPSFLLLPTSIRRRVLRFLCDPSDLAISLRTTVSKRRFVMVGDEDARTPT